MSLQVRLTDIFLRSSAAMASSWSERGVVVGDVGRAELIRDPVRAGRAPDHPAIAHAGAPAIRLTLAVARAVLARARWRARAVPLDPARCARAWCLYTGLPAPGMPAPKSGAGAPPLGFGFGSARARMRSAGLAATARARLFSGRGSCLRARPAALSGRACTRAAAVDPLERRRLKADGVAASVE